jgi:hypothetical protein
MSCGNRDALNPDKFERLNGLALNFKTKLDSFVDALHHGVKRLGLRMTAWQCWNRGYKVAGRIFFKNHIELARHINLHAVEKLYAQAVAAGDRLSRALNVRAHPRAEAAGRAGTAGGQFSERRALDLSDLHGLALDDANGGDEHGILRGAQLPALGDTVWLIPGHCDPTVNLHDFMVGVRGGLQHGTVEQIIRVDSRGALT